ncbi:hypothetical protein P691DRAFT_783139 [Macrolepiota fuliginosa MF-IS2]|uniref:Uncharacterized protein n=1 Tax=Macrolepiota fuliginosa MF-IS2 TaxID=1400762 RepID=A0A9P6BV23_9AGAR|nr:hypothetical protein P691DRAFT_783139 [Macrolepiota fuliginosa MF-IS2]
MSSKWVGQDPCPIQNKVLPDFWHKQSSSCHLGSKLAATSPGQGFLIKRTWTNKEITSQLKNWFPEVFEWYNQTYKDLQFLEMYKPDGDVLATHSLKERQGSQVQRLYLTFTLQITEKLILLWKRDADEEMDWELAAILRNSKVQMTKDLERLRSPQHEVIELLSSDPSNEETSNAEDKVVKKSKGKGKAVEPPQKKYKILSPAPGMITMPSTPVQFGGCFILLEA